MHEFPNKPWSASGLHKLIEMIGDTGGTDRNNNSCRPKSLNQKFGHQTALTSTLWIRAFWKICHKECTNIKGLGICNTPTPEGINGRKMGRTASIQD